MTDTHTYTVVGMTCAHCVASVTEELEVLDGVRDLVVDLDSGLVTFTSEEPVPAAAVAAAVREAGYELA